MKYRFIAKRYWKDHSTPMGAVDVLARAYENVIDLSLGDPDVITHADIIEHAFRDALAGHTKYTDFRGDPELRAAIARYYREDFDVALDDREIMVTTSACLGMYLALEAILDPGDEVIIHSPYFTPYRQQIQLAGGLAVELHTHEEDGFQMDLTLLESLITERTKVIVVNSPNNPTGAVFSEETLKGIAALATKHDLVIISDEIYGAYVFEKPFISMMTLGSALRERLIVLNSFSKDFTMTGWRIGHMLAPPQIIEICQQINENVVFTAPSISQRAAIYALKHRKRIQSTFVPIYKERVLYAVERIRNIPWMRVRKPEGTFYLFINIEASGLSAEKISALLLERARVLTIPGNSFGEAGEGYIRIACTVDMPLLKKAFDAIESLKF